MFDSAPATAISGYSPGVCGVHCIEHLMKVEAGVPVAATCNDIVSGTPALGEATVKLWVVSDPALWVLSITAAKVEAAPLWNTVSVHELPALGVSRAWQ